MHVAPLPPPPFRRALVTGAAGFIGTTLCNHLLGEGVEVVGLDRLSRGRPVCLPFSVPIIRGDIRDSSALTEALQRLGHVPEVCFHLAGAARIADSLRHPNRFTDINAVGTQVVIDECAKAGVECVVLASTAAVLQPPSDPQELLDEDAPIGPVSPYGASKLAAERTLEVAAETGRITGVVARLFNPAGAGHGCAENHVPETHLLPLCLLAAMGHRGALKVFGDDHPTPDGTCMRDYIHVLDACEALFRAAVHRLGRHRGGDVGCDLFHIASGRGHSVREVITAVEAALSRPVPHELAPRRPGDMPSVIGCPAKMEVVLKVRPSTDLTSMAHDAARAMGLLPATHAAR